MIGSGLGVSALALRGGGGPALLIDFAAGQYRKAGQTAASFTALSGTTFARTGAGTAFTMGGGVSSFATGAPRITDRGLLLEPAATNLLPAWTVVGTGYQNANTASSAGPTSPLGSASVTLTTTSTSEGGPRRTGAGMSPSTTYVLSVIAKAGTLDQFFLRNLALAGNQAAQSAYFNLTTGVPGTKGSSVTSSGMIPLADGFYLCRMVGTTLASLPGDLIDVKFDGQPVGRTIHLAQFDLQAAASLQSPIVTGASAATRGADAAAVTVPAGAANYEATYGVGNTVATGAVTPGATFDLVAGRPWVGLGNELKRLVMA